MSPVNVELLVEPFRENEPGPHVRAALTALEDAGLTPNMGPFATTLDGDLDNVTDALRDAVRAAFDQGASSVQLRIATTA